MDDLEFRRRILSEPNARDQDLLAAMRSNESNAQFAEDVRSLDAKIAQAMNVPVPENLADRILLHHSTASQPRLNRPISRKMMALAASFAFVAGLLIGQLHWQNLLIAPAHASLSEMAISHVRNEQAFIEHIDEHAGSVQINAKMRPFAAKLNANFPYHVYYLNHCGFGSASAVHMVFAGLKGKVTLFLVPQTNNKVEHFSTEEMKGIIEPLEQASLIVIGHQDEDLSNIVKRLLPIIQPIN